MSRRKSPLYTRSGDDGSTGLADGSRVAKTAARIEAIGTMDELNCALGIVAALQPGETTMLLQSIQQQLFTLGGELAHPGDNTLNSADIEALEAQIDRLDATLPPLKAFILPGGNPAAAHAHQARAICRRAERTLLRLAAEEPVNPQSLVYLNRLSDLLFIVARRLAHDGDAEEIQWRP